MTVNGWIFVDDSNDRQIPDEAREKLKPKLAENKCGSISFGFYL